MSKELGKRRAKEKNKKSSALFTNKLRQLTEKTTAINQREESINVSDRTAYWNELSRRCIPKIGISIIPYSPDLLISIPFRHERLVSVVLEKKATCRGKNKKHH